jgi:hypothetical protein
MTNNDVSTVIVPRAMDYLPPPDPKAVEQAMLIGDLSQMTDAQRISYYVATCRSLNLNPLTHPFMALKGDDGKLSLYPDKGCAEQLRKLHRVSCKVIGREFLDDLYIVTVRATTPDGREEEAQGVVPIAKPLGSWEQTREGKRYFKTSVDAQGREMTTPLSTAERASALMRAETKAKRRVTLAICGLGMSDWEQEPGQVSHPMALHLQTPPAPVDSPSLAQTIAELSDPVDPTAPAPRREKGESHGPAGEAGAEYLAQIEAVILGHGGQVEPWMRWAERRLQKDRQVFTVADYQLLLTEARTLAAQRQTAKPAGTPPPEGSPAGQDEASTYVVDPETGMLLDKEGKPRPNLMAEEDEPGLFGGDN